MGYTEELTVAKEAAREAGHIMEEYQENGFSIGRKSAYSDLVTEADVACQEKIIEIIEDKFPDDGFLAEENDRVPDGEDRIWVIDPIDGTRNFSRGFSMYCTSIALKTEDGVQVGAVYAPRLDELFSAVRGEGAWINGEPISVSETDDLRDALVAARMSDYTESIHGIEAQILDDLLDDGASFRRIGSAALDLCFVACGRTDGHILITISEWDVAAGRLILEEAGGAFRERNAVVGSYLETVASNGTLQPQFESVVDHHTDGF